MKPSDSQVEEYKERAVGLVEDWLAGESGECFVRTCEVCHSPVRDDSLTDENVLFVVTTLGAFMEHDSEVRVRCVPCSRSVDELTERLLTGRAVAVEGVVLEESGDFELEVESVEFYR